MMMDWVLDVCVRVGVCCIRRRVSDATGSSSVGGFLHRDEAGFGIGACMLLRLCFWINNYTILPTLYLILTLHLWSAGLLLEWHASLLCRN
jgi:hypothetical protein